MLPLPVFRRLLSIAAGLVLSLAGRRSSAVVAAFPPSAGYRHPRPAPRVDTATVVPAQEHPATPQRRTKAAVRPQVPGPPYHATSEKKERVSEPDRSYAEVTPGDTVRNATQPLVPGWPRQYASAKLSSAQTLVHYGLHFVFPVVLALVFFPLMWQTAYLVMLATMAIDLDHLLAKPIFDPLRCS